MLRGTKVLIASIIIAAFMVLINVVMLDSFLYQFTSQVQTDTSSSFYAGGIISKMAQLITFMPILTFGLGLGYFILDRVFGQESGDWIQ